MNGFKQSAGAVMRTPMRTPVRRPRAGVAEITFANPWTVTAYNATYATALAAVANGQNFGYIENGTEVAHIYNRASGTAATYLGTIPYKNGVQADQDSIERIRVGGGVASGAKADIFSVDAYYHFNKIKNRAIGSAPDLNALGSSRPAQLLGTNMIAASGVTLAASTAEDGTQSAVRIVNPSGSGRTASFAFRGLPGLWNYSFRAKTETGSNQTVGVGLGSLGTITVTPTWQDFSVNVAHATTAATRTLFLAGDVAGAAFDITVDQIRVTPGNVSGAASTVDHPFNKTTAPTRAAGYLTNSNAVKTNPYIPLSIDDTTSRTAMSVVMAVKKTAADNTITPFLVEVETASELNSGAGAGLAFENISNTTYTGGSNGAVSRRMISVANGDNWMIVGMACGPGGSRIYVDDVVLSVGVSAAWTGFTARLLELLTFRNNTGFQGNFASCVVYESELTDAAMKSEITRAKSRVALLGQTVQVLKNIYVAEGDSITAGSGSTNSIAGYAMLVGAGFSPYLQGISYGVVNSTLVGALSLQNRQATVVAKIAEIVASGRRPIVSVNIGANDIASITADAATWYANLWAYWAALRSAGAKVCASTILPQQSLTGPQETARLAMNTTIRSDSSKWDALADFASDAAFVGGWSSTYFADSAHPKDAGHTAMAAVVVAAITPLLLV
jgi:lysophospholipase L1-like esterase